MNKAFKKYGKSDYSSCIPMSRVFTIYDSMMSVSSEKAFKLPAGKLFSFSVFTDSNRKIKVEVSHACY